MSRTNDNNSPNRCNNAIRSAALCATNGDNGRVGTLNDGVVVVVVVAVVDVAVVDVVVVVVVSNVNNSVGLFALAFV
jgi:hypothetical protein